ncbi:(2Fe-2S)-binding protein, partial [Salinisphaera sp.]|uniref:(2Fe-2S)-binding protein n=1 Tax=Salinisphaera sp. TaxID=1914330 RepID=UPI002D7863C2
PDQRRGDVFAPMHWSRQYAADARVGALIEAAVCPVSGQPEYKHTPVAVAPFAAAWHGFILAARRLPLAGRTGIDYWVRVTGERFLRYEIAGLQAPDDWAATARDWLGLGRRDADWIEAADPAAGLYRAAHFDAGTLEACVFVASKPAALPTRAWLSGLFTGRALAKTERAQVLAGRPADPAADTGPQICACFGVGANTLRSAIRSRALDSVAAVGEALRAGTNCGACKPEIAALIEQEARHE